MNNILKIGLAVVILVLAYFTYETIAKPIRFQQEKKVRYAKVIQRLKDIRKAETTYKSVYETYTGSFDTLLNFLKYDSLPLIKMVGQIPDELLDSVNEKQAVEMGLIIRDTLYIPVHDSILQKTNIDSLPYIPYTGGAKFKLQAGEIEVSKTKQQVFECKDTKPFDPNQVLKVGSMVEVSTSGNWE